MHKKKRCTRRRKICGHRFLTTKSGTAPVVDKMKKIHFTQTSLVTAPIALGCMRMANIGFENAEKVIHTAIEQRIDLFDHADIYGAGESERVFGQVLKASPGLREKMIIQSKCGIGKGFYNASKEHILSATEGILRRLQLEQIDILLLHRPDALMEPEEVADAFDRLEKAGKVRFFGVSNQNSAQIALLQKYCKQKLIINQLQFGPAHTGMIDAGINTNVNCNEAISKDGYILDYCRLNEICIQAWSPFQYGMFQGVFLNNTHFKALTNELEATAERYGITASAMVAAWIMRHPAGIQTIIGSMNPARICEICSALDINISREEWYRIYLSAGNPLP